MKKEIEKRKRRFFSLCLACLLLCTCIIPGNALAATYDSDNLSIGDSLQPGDVVNYNYGMYSVGITRIYYADTNGNQLTGTDAYREYQFATDGRYSFTVLSYEAASGSADPAFKQWNVKYIFHSGDDLGSLALQAVMYTQSTVTYVLDGGSNNASNPDFYYEGKQVVTLADASKAGYDFKGWYTDPSFDPASKVTEIGVGQTGNVTLYAKFEVSAAPAVNPPSAPADPETYTITYVLNDGTNGEGNPDTYTFGIGVASFADASKEGYDFDGWYSDNAYTRRITELSAGQTGNVVLYAKFTEIQRDEVPQTGDETVMWPIPLMLVSALGLFLVCKKEKELRG